MYYQREGVLLTDNEYGDEEGKEKQAEKGEGQLWWWMWWCRCVRQLDRGMPTLFEFACVSKYSGEDSPKSSSMFCATRKPTLLLLLLRVRLDPICLQVDGRWKLVTQSLDPLHTWQLLSHFLSMPLSTLYKVYSCQWPTTRGDGCYASSHDNYANIILHAAGCCDTRTCGWVDASHSWILLIDPPQRTRLMKYGPLF